MNGPPVDWPRALVLGTRVTVTTFDGAQRMIAALVERRAGDFVSCANVYSIAMAHQDRVYRDLLNSASVVTADGMPIVWALRALGRSAERVHNDDLLPACCHRYPTWRHFLLGGRTGQPEIVAKELRRRFPGVSIVGTHATPRRPIPERETEMILERIENSGADLVWVGMGTPSQDVWMASVAARTRAPMVGCGSVFDLLAGNTRPTPGWMKRNGLQWLFRLAQEPRRLAYRYANYNTRFVLAFSAQWARHTLRGVARRTPPG